MTMQTKFPPMTPAERQRKCRAIKRGEWTTCEQVPVDRPPAQLPPMRHNTPPALSETRSPALPAPATTAITKANAFDAASLAFPEIEGTAEPARLSLPPAVADRLRSLIKRHKAGKTLSDAERAEAQGLLDIAEYFVVQRMRKRLAA